MKKKKSKVTDAPKQPNMEKMLKSWFDAGVDLVKLTTDRLQDNFEEVFDKNELAQKRGKKIEKEFREELEQFRSRMDDRLEMFNNQLSGAFSFFRKRKDSGKIKQRVKDLESLVNGYLDGFLDSKTTKKEEESSKKKSKKKTSKKKKKTSAKKKNNKAKKEAKDKKPKKAKKIVIEVKGSDKKEAPKVSKKMGAPKAKKTTAPKKATTTAKKTAAPKKATTTAKKTAAPKKATTTAKKTTTPKKVVAPRVVKATAPKVSVKKTTAKAPKTTTAKPAATPTAAPRRRGRPAGGKNKPKATTATSTAAKKSSNTRAVKPVKAKADEPVKRFVVDKSIPIMDRIKSRKKALNFDSFGKGVRGNGDDLTVIKGVGKVLSNKLRALGINSYAQISKMSAEDVDVVNEALEYFPGRIAADDWVAQAKALLK